jgi:hypothetical protein
VLLLKQQQVFHKLPVNMVVVVVVVQCRSRPLIIYYNTALYEQLS